MQIFIQYHQIVNTFIYLTFDNLIIIYINEII